MSEEQREQFEAWFKVEFAEWVTAGWENALRRKGGDYANPTVQRNWQTYQAAWSAQSSRVAELEAAKAGLRSTLTQKVNVGGELIEALEAVKSQLEQNRKLLGEEADHLAHVLYLCPACMQPTIVSRLREASTPVKESKDG